MLAKVTVLNALYLTRIMSVYPVVNRILALKIDDRLRAGDEKLVADIAKVALGKKPKILLSFATKYCAFHQPHKFQIFDRRAELALWAYCKKFRFADCPRGELRDYPTYTDAIAKFQRFFGLEAFNRIDIDKFLWIEGG